MAVPRIAVLYTVTALLACLATILVLDQDAAITLEAVEADVSAEQQCNSIQQTLQQEHDRFWEDAKAKVKQTKGEGVALAIQTDFTKEMDSILARMKTAGCGMPMQLENESADCPTLRDLQRSTAAAVKKTVTDLLKDDTGFQQELTSVQGTTTDLEKQLKMLGCGQVLAAAAAAPVPAEPIANSNADVGAVVQGKAAVAEAASQSSPNPAEAATATSLEALQDKIKFHEKELERHKAAVAKEEKNIAEAMNEAKEVLQQHKDAISDHQDEIKKLKKKILVAKWAQNQRDALLKDKPIPPNTAASYDDTPVTPATGAAGPAPKGDELDQQIGNVFEQGFDDSKELPSIPTDGLLQMGASEVLPEEANPSADDDAASKAALASFNAALDAAKIPAAPTKLQKASAAVINDIAHGHPTEKTAIATADALEHVQESVRDAARTAARKAALEAVKKGLGARATKHYVKAAAKKAAAAAAANSHSVFEDALETEPTPEMQAAKKMQLEHKELAAKAAQDKVNTNERTQKDDASTKAAADTMKKSKGLKDASSRVVAGKEGTPTELSNANAAIKKAEDQAVAAEASAWKSDVGGADTADLVLREIEKYQKENPKLSLPQAAQMWEEGEVVKLKKRYARHFSASLSANTTTAEGKLEALHQADRQKINVEKLVLKNAEMHAILAKRNAEKSAKNALRMKDAADRYQLAASDTIKQKLKEIRGATDQANDVQRDAVSKVLAKDASQTLEAKKEANEAKAEAKHATAAKAEALGALKTAREKLQSLSKAAAAGTAMLGVKLKKQLEAQQEQVAEKLKQVKNATTVEVTKQVQQEQADLYAQKWKQAQARLKQKIANETEIAQSHAANVVAAAEAAAESAKDMAKQEAQVAEKAREKSKQIADEATTRAAAIKAASDDQIQMMAKQKQAAMEHFHQFTASLKQLENEKSAKSEAKIQAKQALADAAIQEAARTARFAEQQLTEADLQASQAAINKAAAAGERLEASIQYISNVQPRARGMVSIRAEKKALADERSQKLKEKEDAIELAKEKSQKAVLEAKETKVKNEENEKESTKKTVAKEAQSKHDAIAKEGYQKGVAHARSVYLKKAKEEVQDKAKAEATTKAVDVEKDAKALVKEADVVHADSMSSTEAQATKLVKAAISKTQVGGAAEQAVNAASQKLKAFMKDPTAEPTVGTKLGVETAAAANDKTSTKAAITAVNNAKIAAAQAAAQEGADTPVESAPSAGMHM